MKEPIDPVANHTTPQLLKQAEEIHGSLEKLESSEIQSLMKISDKLTSEVVQKIDNWQAAKRYSAIQYFAGDIYTGLDVNSLSNKDLAYAQQRLIILSGLYGILRPLDLIAPYRLEMGYSLSVGGSKNLFDYWRIHLRKTLPESDVYIHLSSEEYFKSIRPIIKPEAKIIAPVFLTRKSGLARQVTIHSKIARGAYANWLIKNQIEDLKLLQNFDRLEYRYSKELSTKLNPTYIKDV